jgi:AraC family transcriptional regulator of adaptative response / DNA-3-methyladenine glycosylase II
MAVRGPTGLADLVRTHAHDTPAGLLRRERVAAVCRGLIGSNQRALDLAFEAGFESEATFQRQFLAGTAMTPEAYRALCDGRGFLLQLPDDFRPVEALAYHGRDPEGVFERVHGRQLSIVLRLDHVPVLLVIALQPQGARCTVESRHAVSCQMMVEAHTAAMRMLGLYCDSTGFEARAAKQETVRTLIAGRTGLRIPLAPGAFEALVWAVIGQQINLPFAIQLRRALTRLAGEPIGGGRYAHPSPERIAELDPTKLTALRFSRSKAEYLIGVAQAVCTGRLDLLSLTRGSALVAERTLRSIRGLGPWTTHYTLMRGFGLGDCVPVGDSSLSSGLQRLYQLPERPGARETATLMAPFAPHRSLATCHIWASQTKGERA